MGRELQCRMKSGGKWVTGKALLETSEIIFRGEPRLKIPLAALSSVVARSGQLRLEWSGNSAIFELGEHANKWAHAILHPKSTTDKLGLKAGTRISAIHMPDDETKTDARQAAAAFADDKPLRDSDTIFLGAATTSELARIPKLLTSLAPNGMLWVIYPKGRKEITELQVLEAGRAAGLVDIKVVRYSTTHTALKFVRPKAGR